jgi:hypothetical protein
MKELNICIPILDEVDRKLLLPRLYPGLLLNRRPANPTKLLLSVLSNVQVWCLGIESDGP